MGASSPQGVFITFEGGEGVGKSTQIRLLEARLNAAGVDVLCVREPGGTRAGEKIRSILLDPANSDLDPRAELLLYEAARAQLVEQHIKPALARGITVLCDRFTDSTLAYQGYARGLDVGLVTRANEVGSGGLAPNRTIVLERDIAESLGEATQQGADRLEAEGIGFHTRVHEGFEQLAASDPRRVRRVPCHDEKAHTAQAVWEQVASLFPQAATRAFVVTPELIRDIKEHK
ncbi:MAG: dTMP kinase [Coriobacteriales bacterium]|jgi:dTMP kinase|nr:dTMP kinase [Coriobacteriales bacterium]